MRDPDGQEGVLGATEAGVRPQKWENTGSGTYCSSLTVVPRKVTGFWTITQAGFATLGCQVKDRT